MPKELYMLRTERAEMRVREPSPWEKLLAGHLPWTRCFAVALTKNGEHVDIPEYVFAEDPLDVPAAVHNAFPDDGSFGYLERRAERIREYLGNTPITPETVAVAERLDKALQNGQSLRESLAKSQASRRKLIADQMAWQERERDLWIRLGDRKREYRNLETAYIGLEQELAGWVESAAEEEEIKKGLERELEEARNTIHGLEEDLAKLRDSGYFPNDLPAYADAALRCLIVSALSPERESGFRIAGGRDHNTHPDFTRFLDSIGDIPYLCEARIQQVPKGPRTAVGNYAKDERTRRYCIEVNYDARSGRDTCGYKLLLITTAETSLQAEFVQECLKRKIGQK